MSNDLSSQNKEEVKFQDTIHGLFLQIMRLEGGIIHHVADNINLHPGQFHLLIMLKHQDGISQKELAERACVSAPTITVMLNAMEHQKLIYKEKDSQDRRVTKIYLTESGLCCAKQIRQLHLQLGNLFLHNFSIEEQILLKRFLVQIRDNLLDIKEQDLNLANKEEDTLC